MALVGNLDTMPLPDVLQFLGLGRKTGVLLVEAGPVRKQLVLEDGRVVFCSAGHAKEYLGQHLLARTPLTEAELTAAFAEQEQTGDPLGEILVRRGKLTVKDLETVLRRKVEDSIYDLFTWRLGRFTFQEGAVPRDLVPIRLDLGWQDVVMEGARRSDELARLRAIVAGDHVRFRVRRARFPEGFPKASGDKKLVALAEQGLTVGDMLPRFHASDFDILQRLATLVTEGQLEIDEASLAGGELDDSEKVALEGLALLHAGRVADALALLRDASRNLPPGNPDIDEAMRAVESRLREQFAAGAGSLDAVPRLPRDLGALTSAELSSKEAFVVSRINGQWSVRAIAQICPFDEIEVLAILDGLARRRLITLEAAVAERVKG